MTDRVGLLMMPDGDRPDAADFAAADEFTSFEAAVRSAHERAGPSEPLVPWIKVGADIMDPAQVMAINTPPAPVEPAPDHDSPDRLDDELADTFPASDPPSRTAP